MKTEQWVIVGFNSKTQSDRQFKIKNQKIEASPQVLQFY